MAKQAGNIQITGTIGNLTFYKTQDGYLVKTKSSVSKETLKGPKYARFQDHQAEFGNGGKAVKLIRRAWQQAPRQCTDNRVTGRLSQLIAKKIIQAEKFSPFGKRNMDDADISPLENFDCNINAPLGEILLASYTCTSDRETGGMRIDFDDFVPVHDICFPQGATHFRICSFAADINFTEQQKVDANFSTPPLLLDRKLVSGLSVIHLLPPESTNHRLLLLAISFCQVVNGFEYPILDENCNAMRIVLADGRGK